MHWFQALLLGLLQGLTEFFPISSSAHLKFARHLMGLPEGEQWLYFDLLCHAGTWIALCWYLRKEIWEVLRSPRQIALFSAALAPLVPAYFLLKPLRVALSDPHWTGYFLFGTAALLWIASKMKSAALSSGGSISFSPPKFRDVVCVGWMQSLALLPGLSRSGSTIAAGRLCGWSWTQSARFSFLLAVPTILGGELLESVKLFMHSESAHLSKSAYCIAFFASLAAGLFSVRLIFRIYERSQITPFIAYCAAFGTLLLWVYHG